jgi:hypothetical protein
MKTIRMIAVLAFASLFAANPALRAEQPVHFDDANLKAAVEAALGKTNPTPTDMLSLVALNAHGRGITSLVGLEYATNLATLDLANNHISSLLPLSGLVKLGILELSHNQISSISPLAALTKLVYLLLDYNQISDLSPLSGLTTLADLELGYNKVSNLSPLSGLTDLQIVYLDANQIVDLSPLSGLGNVFCLTLSRNQISSLSPLAGLTNLERLEFYDNRISNISPLAGLTNLQDLGLGRNQIRNISPLASLTNLKELYLNDNQISDISPLVGLTSLVELCLYGDPLGPDACNIYIPQMESHGTTVEHDPCVGAPVPNVVGMTQAEAEAALTAAGFQVGEIWWGPSDLPEGTVFDQDPAGGEMAAPGSAVDLTLSQASAGPIVPGTGCLVAHWELDETAGLVAADSSGNNYHGVLYGGPVWQPTGGKLGGALQFDGVNDYVDCGNPSALNIQDKITLACWIKVAAFTKDWETILAKGDNSYRFSRSGGNGIHFGVGGTSAWAIEGAKTVTGNQWHHVAGVYDGSQATIYVDGIVDVAVPATGKLNVNSFNFAIGENLQQRGRYLNGLVDDVRVYNCALSAAEIAQLVGPGDPNLVGWWKLDETSGDIAYDSAGQNDGVAYGGPVWQPTGGKVGGAIRFDGVDDYVRLPIGSLIGSLTDSTFANWVNWSGQGGYWQRIFDFGSGTASYMFLTPTGGTSLRFAIKKPGGGESVLDGPSNLAPGWHHIAVAINGTTKAMQLYLDGSVVRTATTQALPKDLGNTTQNWLGRSQYPDPYFNGSLDDFRIYNRVLSAAEVAQLAAGSTSSGGAAGGVAWIRQLGTSASDDCRSVSADGLGNVYVTGATNGSLGGPNAGGYDAFLSNYDSSGNCLWTRQFGTSADDSPGGVSCDGLGNVYVAVATYGSLGGPNAGYRDVCVSKYNSSGSLLWMRQFGTSHEDLVCDLSADGLGNVYVAGNTGGSLGTPSAGSNDVFVAKYNSTGDRLWTRQFGTSDNEQAYDVSADGRGSVYVTGYTLGSLADTNAGASDAFVAKFDSSGNCLWTRQFGTSGYEYANDISANGLGDVYLAGQTTGSLGAPNTGGTDAFVCKFDSSGDLLWTRQFGTSDDDLATAISADGTGNVYVGARTKGSLAGPSAGDYDVFVGEYDSQGNLLWSRQLGTPSEDDVFCLSAGGLRNVYASGKTKGSLGGTNAGDYDAFVAKLASDSDSGSQDGAGAAGPVEMVIGDFEQSMQGWGPTWDTPVPTLTYSTTGVTSGQSSLAIKPNKNGFQWSFMYSGLLDLKTYNKLSVDVTWVAAEWGTTSWSNFKEMVVNSDGRSGWKQHVPSDPFSPDWPGSWSPATWGDQTRTLVWDLSDYDATGATWMQLIFSTNFDGSMPGTYYIDNVRLIGSSRK